MLSGYIGENDKSSIGKSTVAMQNFTEYECKHPVKTRLRNPSGVTKPPYMNDQADGETAMCHENDRDVNLGAAAQNFGIRMRLTISEPDTAKSSTNG